MARPAKQRVETAVPHAAIPPPPPPPFPQKNKQKKRKKQDTGEWKRPLSYLYTRRGWQPPARTLLRKKTTNFYARAKKEKKKKKAQRKNTNKRKSKQKQSARLAYVHARAYVPYARESKSGGNS